MYRSEAKREYGCRRSDQLKQMYLSAGKIVRMTWRLINQPELDATFPGAGWHRNKQGYHRFRPHSV